MTIQDGDNTALVTIQADNSRKIWGWVLGMLSPFQLRTSNFDKFILF